MEFERAVVICRKCFPKDLVKGQHMWHGYEDDELIILKEAVDTVLSELNTMYNKGYQDGFKQAKFDCEMDKVQKEMTVSELAKIIKNDIELGEYCTDCRFYDYCHPQVNEALCSTIEDIIKIAKEKKEVE